jgi:hypothetical protein
LKLTTNGSSPVPVPVQAGNGVQAPGSGRATAAWTLGLSAMVKQIIANVDTVNVNNFMVVPFHGRRAARPRGVGRLRCEKREL